ncbi:MAG: nitroreductase family protein, partial [Pyrinomonadaceae bacterium]|nr:nitroreductase family protein [Pyrinomonadaceae bacterium]
REVEPSKLRQLLEAARWAASCFNEQPWSFIVARKTDAAEFARLLGCLVESNRRWAKHAPVLMLSIAKLNFERNNKPNRHAFHDVGQAAASLTLQATTLGLVVHQMAGFEIEKARAEYGLPEGYEPVAGIAIGYQGDASALPKDLREKELAPRTRRTQTGFVFKGKWGEPWQEE